MKKTTILFGGAGFLGRALVDLLIQKDRVVLAVGRRPASEVCLPPECQYLQGDYGDRDFLRRVVRPGCEVVDLAYSTVPQTSFQDPVFDLLSNLPASVGLLQEAAACGAGKVLFVSSGGTVYGPAKRLPIEEDHPTEPISPYGITKLAIEKYARMFSKTSGLHVVIARPGNAYGMNQRAGTGQGFIAAAIHAALNGNSIEVYGGKGTKRDYIHVDDVAEGLWAVLQSGENGEAYNIGTGIASSNQQIIAILRGLAARKSLNLETETKPTRVFDVPANSLDCSKLQGISGWKACHTLRKGIEKIWDASFRAALQK